MASSQAGGKAMSCCSTALDITPALNACPSFAGRMSKPSSQDLTAIVSADLNLSTKSISDTPLFFVATAPIELLFGSFKIGSLFDRQQGLGKK